MKFFRTPTPVRWLFHRRVWGFSRKEGFVYLTFDDGPTVELTEQILGVLDDHDVKATFFCVGENAKLYPKLMESMQSKGHVIGNHTMRHEKGTKVSWKDYSDSIGQAQDVIESPLFRPPYGRVRMDKARKLRKNFKVVMWTWLSYDYDHSVSIEEIIEAADRIKSGDILVLHDNLKVEDRVLKILPEIIRIVREKGLKFATISV